MTTTSKKPAILKTELISSNMNLDKLIDLRNDRFKLITQLRPILDIESTKLFREFLRLNRQIENEMANSDSPTPFNIRKFITENFSKNGSGYHENVPFKLKLRGAEFIHVDTIWNESGITRFQGCVVGSYGTPITPESFIYPLIRRAEILTIYNGTHPCWTIWFKEPVTQEILDKLTEQFLEENKVVK